MNNFYFTIILNCFFISTYSQHLRVVKDSSAIYFSKVESIGFDRTVSTDSILLKISYIRRAIKFQDCDSFWSYLAGEYQNIYKFRELQKCDLRALRANVQTNKYSENELGDYLSALEFRGGYKRVLKIYNKNTGDTIIFKGRQIKYNRDIELKTLSGYISDIKDSVKLWRTLPDLGECYYGGMAKYYFELGHYWQSQLSIKHGLKKFPNSSCIYLDGARIDMKKGNYKKATKEFNKAAVLGSETASNFLPMTKLWLKIH